MSATSKARKRRKMNIYVPTAAMGDIAFLLIIFFMLTSKFMQESHVTYKDPESPDVLSLDDTPFSVIVDEKGTIWLQGKEAPNADYLKEGLIRLVAGKHNPIVMLKVDQNATSEQFIPVISALGEANVRIAMVGTKSKSY